MKFYSFLSGYLMDHIFYQPGLILTPSGQSYFKILCFQVLYVCSFSFSQIAILLLCREFSTGFLQVKKLLVMCFVYTAISDDYFFIEFASFRKNVPGFHLPNDPSTFRRPQIFFGQSVLFFIFIFINCLYFLTTEMYLFKSSADLQT